MPELLLEILSEEIPARMQARAGDDLKRLAGEGFVKAGLAAGKIEIFITPRRLVLVADGLPAKQSDVAEERRGPRVDAPQAAIDGFLRANGLTLDQCEKRDTGKGVFWFAVIKKAGQKTAEILPTLLIEVLGKLPWPKSMHWNGPTRWIRPVRNVVAIFDGHSLRGGVLGLPFRMTTSGHRFLAPKLMTVRNFADYKKRLLKAKIVLDPAERRAVIERDAAKLARSKGLALIPDEGLFAEVAGLVEWPVALLGRIDQAFMDLPPEVLTTVMRHHQKYFALNDKAGKLAPFFVVVANIATKDKGAAIVAGNERVLRARLADARFFWDQDRKKKLVSRVPALKDRVFHAKLGNDFVRVQRLRLLAAELSKYVPGADRAAADRAAELCKADLTTGMVGEFPELQGIVGRYYALNDGESAVVADAIADHYRPLGPNDACPRAPISVVLALADKIDTLVGFFAINEKPTGSRDPFALRRAALGVIRLIVENKLRLNLTALLRFSCETYLRSVDAVKELLDFFADRLIVQQREKGVRHDLIRAVFSQRQTETEIPGGIDLIRVLMRVEALEKFLSTNDGANLLIAYRRAANIVRIEEKKDKVKYDGNPDEQSLREPDEIKLNSALASTEALAGKAIENEDFVEAMGQLAKLRPLIDRFFDHVTVNCDDVMLRKNRLRLLSRIQWTMDHVADFSRIEG
jgi:glycyl-tRNA synthetase beta chain